MGDDRVLYQPTAFSKKKVHPGIFIFNTPTGSAVNLNVPIQVEVYRQGIDDEPDYVLNKSVEVKFVYKKPETSSQKVSKDYGIPIMKFNEFSDRITRNEEGQTTQLVVVWQGRTFTGPNYNGVHSVVLTFTLNDGTEITTDMIVMARAANLKPSRKRGGNAEQNTLYTFYNNFVRMVYERLGDGQQVDLVQLADELPVYDTGRINNFRQSVVIVNREDVANSHFNDLEIHAPKFISAVPMAPFFLLVKKDIRERPMSDYNVESIIIEPSDCGFTLESLGDNTPYMIDSLAGAYDMYFRGEQVRNVYTNLNHDPEGYIVKRFYIAYDVEEDKLPATVDVEITLPFNNKYGLTLHVVDNLRPIIVDVARMLNDPGAIGGEVNVDDNDFQETTHSMEDDMYGSYPQVTTPPLQGNNDTTFFDEMSVSSMDLQVEDDVEPKITSPLADDSMSLTDDGVDLSDIAKGEKLDLGLSDGDDDNKSLSSLEFSDIEYDNLKMPPTDDDDL